MNHADRIADAIETALKRPNMTHTQIVDLVRTLVEETLALVAAEASDRELEEVGEELTSPPELRQHPFNSTVFCKVDETEFFVLAADASVDDASTKTAIPRQVWETWQIV